LIIESQLLKEGILDSSMEFIFTFGPLILDAFGGVAALTGFGLPLAGALATASRGISIGGCFYYAYKLNNALDNDSFSEGLFATLGLIFSAASVGIPGAGPLAGALTRGVVRSLEKVFKMGGGALKIAKTSLDIVKNSKVYKGLGEALMNSKIIGLLSRAWNSSFIDNILKLLSGLKTGLSEVTTIGLSSISKRLAGVVENIMPFVRKMLGKIDNFFSVLKYGKLKVVPAEEVALLTHATMASEVAVANLSDDAVRIIASASDELAGPLGPVINSIPKEKFSKFTKKAFDKAREKPATFIDDAQKFNNRRLAAAGAVKDTVSEVLYLEKLIHESKIKTRVIKNKKIINLIN